MAGRTLASSGSQGGSAVAGVFVKSPVFPFVRFPGVDTILGPEMKSTGEVWGGRRASACAFAKAQLAGRAAFAGARHRVRQREQRRQGQPPADPRAISQRLGFQPHRVPRHGWRICAPMGSTWA